MMNEIKSKKALDYIESEYAICHVYGTEFPYIDPECAKQAVFIAETEADERHAKELQGFKNYIESILDVIDNADHLCEVRRFVELNASFTQKLNEQ